MHALIIELETIRNDILRKRTLNSINFLIDSHGMDFVLSFMCGMCFPVPHYLLLFA